MKKSEAKKQIEKLRRKINNHNYKYYVENSPVISDFEFDQLLKKLEALEEKYPELVTLDSPTQMVRGCSLKQLLADPQQKAPLWRALKPLIPIMEQH